MRRDVSVVTLNYDRLVEGRETKWSWYFIFEGRGIYLPKSQVEDIRETSKEVDIPQWLVEDRELEDYSI